METKKWGTGKKKGPQWARTRAIVTWNSRKTWKAPSWDYTKKFTAGVPTKIKSELTGLTKLVEMICGIDPWSYGVINVFVNLTSNLDVNNGNFDYHILTIVRGKLTWKNPIYWKVDDPNNMDVKKMRAYQEAKLNEQAREEARIQVQLALEGLQHQQLQK